MGTRNHAAFHFGRVVPVLFLILHVTWMAFPQSVVGAERVAGLVEVAPTAESSNAGLWYTVYRQGKKPLSPGSMDAGIRFKLERAHAVALQRVAEVETCGGLFADFEADGLEMLLRSVYLQANPGQEHEVCGLGAAAWTAVGRPHTTLCPRFSRMTTDRAAIILIHEALHFAGMKEKPHDPDAMSSAQINRLVSDRCAP